MTDKFTPELWLTTTPAEDYLRAEEGFSLPASVALVKQVGVIGTNGSKVLDLGTGLGQITQTIMEQTSDGAVQVVTADKDEGLLDVVRGKKEARGWGDKVTLQLVDAMVCFVT
jgi:ubiquinone/menaquinone biosynthesis C-methylase UbiE